MANNKQYRMHRMKVADIVADSLEAEARKMPPSYKVLADIYHAQAKAMRKADSRWIWVREEVRRG
jgi:hypothetical protein